MAYTDKYRDQHVELASLANQLGRAADQLRTEEDCARVRKDLSQLSGKLMVHLSMEDRGMYPRLSTHENAELRAAAASFAREMGGIAEAFTAYNTKWTSGAIKADVAGFAAETRKVVQILMSRIQRENTHLYPMVDRHVA
jgi:hypothetical protein